MLEWKFLVACYTTVHLGSTVIFTDSAHAGTNVSRVSAFEGLCRCNIRNRHFVILRATNDLTASRTIFGGLGASVGLHSRDDLRAITALFSTTRVINRYVHDVVARTRDITGSDGDDAFADSFVLNKRVGNRPPRLCVVCPRNGYVETARSAPFFRLNRDGCNGPVLSHSIGCRASIGRTARTLVLSFSSAVRSGLSMNVPVSLLVCRGSDLAVPGNHHVRRSSRCFGSVDHR